MLLSKKKLSEKSWAKLDHKLSEFMFDTKVKGWEDAQLAANIYRGSYMSAHVLLNLLNELRKRDKMRG